MRGSLFSFGLVAPLPHEFLREGRQPQEILRNEAITGSERAIGSSGNADRPNKLNGAHRFPERHDAGVTVGAYIPDATTTLTYKDKFIDLVNRWVGAGTPATDKIETVINSSIAAGVNPIFTLAIWLHESDASNYDGICNKLGGGSGSSTYCTHLLDFGVNKNAIASNYITQQFYFNEQLNSFLNLPGYYKDVCKTEMAASECPMRIFMAMFDLGQCTPTDETDNYMKSIMSIYKTIAPSENYPCYPSTYP